MSEFAEVFRSLDWSILINLLLSVIPALVCITIHELSHGLVAYCLGDNTAKDQGRLTLNPLKHIDVLGLLMMIFARFGWAKPVPVNMQNFKRPKLYMAITALAGPVSNFILTAFILVFQVPLQRLAWFSTAGYLIANAIYTTALISLYLGIFNLLPIPPLDGSKIVFSLLRDEHYNALMRYERIGMIILVALIWTNRLSGPLNAAASWVFSLIENGTYWLSSLIFS